MKPNHCTHMAEYWNEMYKFNYWRGVKEFILDLCFNRVEYYLRISR